MLANDFLLALICWLVFGPPMATYIASEFSTGIFEIFYSEWTSFFFPTTLAILYLYIFGFYKSLIKFFDSKDSIIITLTGSLVFGFSLVDDAYIPIPTNLYFFFINCTFARLFIISSLLCIFKYFTRCCKIFFISIQHQHRC